MLLRFFFMKERKSFQLQSILTVKIINRIENNVIRLAMFIKALEVL